MIKANDDGSLRIDNVLIVRLDDCRYGIDLPSRKGLPPHSLSNITVYSRLPSLRDWVKLWWRLRHLRNTQSNVETAIRVRN